MTTPLDDVEAALVNASNALWEIDQKKKFHRYVELNEAIDGALRLTQAWKEDDAGQSGDYDAP
jgi:hypothetical protein